MPTSITREFERGTMAYLNLLDKVEKQTPSLFDRSRIKKVRKEIEELRLEALAVEVREVYPDIKIDYE